MRQDIDTLESFYASPMGQLALDNGLRRLTALWPDMDGQSVLGFGFCTPYLSGYSGTAKRIVLAMPAGQGAHAVQALRPGGGNITLMTEEDRLPFPPASFDRVFIAHGIEEAPNAARLLEEIHRVMKPEGQIVILAANRGGMWARSDHSPFGAGRPYSRQQLSNALRAAKFTPTIWAGALYAPPWRRIRPSGFAATCEKFGETVWPGFSGLVLVEAVKRLYANLPQAGAGVSARTRLKGVIPVSGGPIPSGDRRGAKKKEQEHE